MPTPTPPAPAPKVPMPTPTPPVPTNGEGRKEELARAARNLRDALRRREDEAKRSQATKDQAPIAAAEAKVAQVQQELDELTRQAAFERERATQVAAARDDCARQLAEARGAAEFAEQTARTQSEEGLRDKQLATAAQGDLRNCEERERAMRAAKETAEARALQLESDVASANEARDECRLRLNSAVQDADTAGRNFQEALRAALAGASENAAALEDAAGHAADAQEKLRACEERVQSASMDLATAQETLRRVRNEHASAEQAAHTAAEEMTTMRQDTQAAQEEVLFLNEQLARTNAELAGVTAIIDQKEQEIKSMEEHLESLRTDLDKKSMRYELEQEDYERRLVILTSEKEAALIAASNMCEARVTQADEKANAAEVARDAAQQRAERTMREKVALETQISRLSAEVANKANLADLAIEQMKRENDLAIANANAARAAACDAAAERDISELKQELKQASVILLWANQLDASHVDSMFGSTGTRLERYKRAANAMREKYETALDSVRADLKAKYKLVRGAEYPEYHESAIRAMMPKQIAHLARKLHSEVSRAGTPSATTFLRMTLEDVREMQRERELAARSAQATAENEAAAREAQKSKGGNHMPERAIETDWSASDRGVTDADVQAIRERENTHLIPLHLFCLSRKKRAMFEALNMGDAQGMWQGYERYCKGICEKWKVGRLPIWDVTDSFWSGSRKPDKIPVDRAAVIKFLEIINCAISELCGCVKPCRECSGAYIRPGDIGQHMRCPHVTGRRRCLCGNKYDLLSEKIRLLIEDSDEHATLDITAASQVGLGVHAERGMTLHKFQTKAEYQVYDHVMRLDSYLEKAASAEELYARNIRECELNAEKKEQGEEGSADEAALERKREVLQLIERIRVLAKELCVAKNEHYYVHRHFYPEEDRQRKISEWNHCRSSIDEWFENTVIDGRARSRLLLANKIAFVLKKACDEIGVDPVIEPVREGLGLGHVAQPADSQALRDFDEKMADTFHSISQQTRALIAEAQAPIPDAMKKASVDRRVKSRREIYQKKRNELAGVENKGLLGHVASLFSW
jgi:hypothetical protein